MRRFLSLDEHIPRQGEDTPSYANSQGKAVAHSTVRPCLVHHPWCMLLQAVLSRTASYRISVSYLNDLVNDAKVVKNRLP